MFALLITLALLTIAVWLTRRFARGFLRPGQRRSTRTPATLGFDGEPFEAITPRGALRGWFVRSAREPRMTVIMVHGWQSHAGDMLGWIAPVLDAGCHAVVYDTMGHGHSDPSEFTSIRHFLEDVRAMVAHAQTMPDVNGLVLFGHSMGGGAALLAAADDTRVRGVIAAAAPTDALEITREWLDARRLPGHFLITVMTPFWKPIVQGPFARLKPITRIGDVKAPVLIMHGSEDKQVSVEHATRFAAAHPSARMEVLEGADHLSIPKHPRYASLLREFLGEIGAPTGR